MPACFVTYTQKVVYVCARRKPIDCLVSKHYMTWQLQYEIDYQQMSEVQLYVACHANHDSLTELKLPA
jgi:hypothetical protein